MPRQLKDGTMTPEQIAREAARKMQERCAQLADYLGDDADGWGVGRAIRALNPEEVV